MSHSDRLFLISDIHGCFDELEELLQISGAHKHLDKCVALGDMINKGPRSAAVIKWAMKNKVTCLMGNHELRFLDYVDNPKKRDRKHKGFDKIIERLDDKLPKAIEWMRSLPLYIEMDDLILVHAWVEPDLPISKQKPEVLTNIRTWDHEGGNFKNPVGTPWHHFYTGKKPIVYGHFARQGYLENKNTICIDTGCCYGKQLTGMWWPSRKLFQVKAREEYCPIPKFKPGKL